MSVCLCVCVCLSVSTINNGSIHLKLEHTHDTVVYENSSEKFDIGYCMIKVKVTSSL